MLNCRCLLTLSQYWSSRDTTHREERRSKCKMLFQIWKGPPVRVNWLYALSGGTYISENHLEFSCVCRTVDGEQEICFFSQKGVVCWLWFPSRGTLAIGISIRMHDNFWKEKENPTVSNPQFFTHPPLINHHLLLLDTSTSPPYTNPSQYCTFSHRYPISPYQLFLQYFFLITKHFPSSSTISIKMILFHVLCINDQLKVIAG